MPDLAARIRATLAERQPMPSGYVEAPEVLDEAQWADLVQRFKAAQLEPNRIRVILPSMDDRIANALLAVLDQQPTEAMLLAVAEALGIEASDA